VFQEKRPNFGPNPTLQPADLKIRAETPGENNFCTAESSYGP